MNLPQDVLVLNNAFKKRGKKLYVVGGAVRDYIEVLILNNALKKIGKNLYDIGRDFFDYKPKDYDLTTDALPNETIEIAKSLNFPTVEVGKSFGVIIVGDYEIATFREDIGSGRRPESVNFTTIENDVNRRDLTINALFYDIDKKEVVDLVGGVEDLLNKIIKTVGNPIERFEEDPLRKLRALRFASSLGGSIEDKTAFAIKENPSLNGISKERIRDEFLKSIGKAKSVKDYFLMLEEFDFISQIFPDLKLSLDVPEEKNYIILISYLLKENNPDIIEKYLNNLKYVNDEIKKISFLISLYHFDVNNLMKLKKRQSVSDITEEEIIKFGKYVGEDFKKFINFKPTVTIEDVPKDLVGKNISNWILNKEIENFNSMNENRLLLKNMLKKVILENLKK